ncbi:unnamed protein product [Zymoseptoria tritici ST99CH_1A5]|uniref:Uncharacterized protein n=1 Tax=Zymoseptoria tritici ST99CH_1A5 TaxID=1276529 RepID=A0A1Y6LDX8_ZYMTR|nr:unnamed protein product [Zymoseptoria tritici ST99CH_1A5]
MATTGAKSTFAPYLAYKRMQRMPRDMPEFEYDDEGCPIVHHGELFCRMPMRNGALCGKRHERADHLIQHLRAKIHSAPASKLFHRKRNLGRDAAQDWYQFLSHRGITTGPDSCGDSDTTEGDVASETGDAPNDRDNVQDDDGMKDGDAMEDIRVARDGGITSADHFGSVEGTSPTCTNTRDRRHLSLSRDALKERRAMDKPSAKVDCHSLDDDTVAQHTDITHNQGVGNNEAAPQDRNDASANDSSTEDRGILAKLKTSTGTAPRPGPSRTWFKRLTAEMVAKTEAAALGPQDCHGLDCHSPSIPSTPLRKIAAPATPISAGLKKGDNTEAHLASRHKKTSPAPSEPPGCTAPSSSLITPPSERRRIDTATDGITVARSDGQCTERRPTAKRVVPDEEHPTLESPEEERLKVHICQTRVAKWEAEEAKWAAQEAKYAAQEAKHAAHEDMLNAQLRVAQAARRDGYQSAKRRCMESTDVRTRSWCPAD